MRKKEWESKGEIKIEERNKRAKWEGGKERERAAGERPTGKDTEEKRP